MSDEYGPYTFRCILFGCDWGQWVAKGTDSIVAGRKCRRCKRWEYEDGSTMPPSARFGH